MSHSSNKTEKTDLVIADHFRLQRLIIAKNSVETWEASDIKNDQLILLKLFPPQVYERRRYWSRMQQIFSITREWQHSGVLAFHHIEQTQDPFFFIGSKYLQGKTLNDYLRQFHQNKNPPPLDRILSILWQIASILDCAHSHRIGHFSLKPGNIFICSDGTLRITDFLVPSEIRLAMLSQMRLVDFTNEDYYYLAPESLNGQIPTKQSDLFSLASIAYHTLTGVQPDYATWNKILSHNSSSPIFTKTVYKEIETSQYKTINQTLLRGLSLSPENRHSGCRKFMGEILQCMDKNHNTPDLQALFLSGEDPERNKKPAQKTNFPNIVIKTESKSRPFENKPKIQSSWNWKIYAWLLNLLLLICICAVGYSKRELLMQRIWPNKPVDLENQKQTPAPPVIPSQTNVNPPPRTSDPERPYGPVNYESVIPQII